jgi:hypothetical protein
VGEQVLTATKVLAQGTRAAQVGKSLGEMVGGALTTVSGAGGELVGGAASSTGLGAVVGVPAMVVSAGVVTGGIGNMAAGVHGLSAALMMKGGGDGGSSTPERTEPTLPSKTIASEGDVRVEHYYKSGDHPPAHAHVTGGGQTTRIGPNGKPLAGDPELTAAQRSAVDANRSAIRSAIRKIGRWLNYKEAE